MIRNLTIKQENFCNFYIESGNASEAYRKAYACGKMKFESVNRKAFDLVNNVKIAARVKELQGELRKKSDITKERVLNEYAKVAFSSIAHLHNTWINRKEFDELTDEQKSCIKSIQTKTQRVGETCVEIEYVKVELYDKLKALDSISVMLGYNAPIKTESTVQNVLITKNYND